MINTQLIISGILVPIIGGEPGLYRFYFLMCIVGINLVDFIEILIKSIIKHLIGVNLVKITKLGREIIEILIISMVQTHKLLILQGIN